MCSMCLCVFVSVVRECGVCVFVGCGWGAYVCVVCVYVVCACGVCLYGGCLVCVWVGGVCGVFL